MLNGIEKNLNAVFFFNLKELIGSPISSDFLYFN